ncbi:hypothetical protein BLNAU_8924 [Blattamonas nauphoetae]|uniref:Uncharacterized protein n=1 Tax=Blattamonas nauphoetae TaxID=2049346 RepID=A0ABQ9XXD9_9EUKA|nr:hypothetical protein BLNAU_8924 [Blattamonas nauphoetae]
MKMLGTLILDCSAKVGFALVNADLIPHLVSTLNPLSLPFTEAVDLHVNLMKSINWTFCLITPLCLAELGIRGHDEQQAVRETSFSQSQVVS